MRAMIGMSCFDHRRASIAGVTSPVWWKSHSSVQMTAQPPSALTPRMAAMLELGYWVPMPLQCGT